jgi:hypothetical protein
MLYKDFLKFFDFFDILGFGGSIQTINNNRLHLITCNKVLKELIFADGDVFQNVDLTCCDDVTFATIINTDQMVLNTQESILTIEKCIIKNKEMTACVYKMPLVNEKGNPCVGCIAIYKHKFLEIFQAGDRLKAQLDKHYGERFSEAFMHAGFLYQEVLRVFTEHQKDRTEILNFLRLNELLPLMEARGLNFRKAGHALEDMSRQTLALLASVAPRITWVDRPTELVNILKTPVTLFPYARAMLKAFPSGIVDRLSCSAEMGIDSYTKIDLEENWINQLSQVMMQYMMSVSIKGQHVCFAFNKAPDGKDGQKRLLLSVTLTRSSADDQEMAKVFKAYNSEERQPFTEFTMIKPANKPISTVVHLRGILGMLMPIGGCFYYHFTPDVWRLIAEFPVQINIDDVEISEQERFRVNSRRIDTLLVTDSNSVAKTLLYYGQHMKSYLGYAPHTDIAFTILRNGNFFHIVLLLETPNIGQGDMSMIGFMEAYRQLQNTMFYEKRSKFVLVTDNPSVVIPDGFEPITMPLHATKEQYYEVIGRIWPSRA